MIIRKPFQACREDWKDFNLNPSLLANLAKNNFKYPITPQKFALRPILHGEDARVITKTGTGKTLTFVIPIIQKLLDSKITVKNSISKNRFRNIVNQKCRPVHIKVNFISIFIFFCCIIKFIFGSCMVSELIWHLVNQKFERDFLIAIGHFSLTIRGDFP